MQPLQARRVRPPREPVTELQAQPALAEREPHVELLEERRELQPQLVPLDGQLRRPRVVATQLLQPGQPPPLLLLRECQRFRQVEVLVDQVPNEREQHRRRVRPRRDRWLP